MKKIQKSLVLIFALVLLICAASFSASAATKYDTNKISVSTWLELQKALEQKPSSEKPVDMLVTLKNDIEETWDGYTDIFIKNSGNITLDLNGHNISISSLNGDSLFLLDGNNETVFTIINSQQNSDNYIAFNSEASGSSLIYSRNPNASINILGAYREYSTSNPFAASSYNITLKTSLMDGSKSEAYHATLFLRKVKDVYISGAKLENNTKNPVNIYMSVKPNSIRLAGKTELYVKPESEIVDHTSFENIYLSEVLEYGEQFKIFENCYVVGNKKVESFYIKANNYNSTNIVPVYLIRDLVYGYDKTTVSLTHYKVYNTDLLKNSNGIGNTGITQYKDFCVKSTCCETETIKKTTSVNNYGHISRCTYCNGVMTVELHKFTKLINRGSSPTCQKDGRVPTLGCSLGDDCAYRIGGEIIPKSHTNIVKDPAIAPTCSKVGITAGSHCAACNEVIVKQNVIAKTPHTEVKDKAVESTCASTGLTEGSHCSVCGETIVAQETVAKKAHTYKTTTTKATTAKSGSKVTSCTVCGYVKSKYTISKISSVTLSTTSYTYNGNKKTPTVTIKSSKGTKLKEGTDYIVKYSSSSRKNVGTYTVTVTFKGNYSGTKKLTFKIVPKSTSISKLTAGKKSFTAKWSKQSTQTTGYQIQYSTSSKMTNASTKTISKNSTTSQTIKSLKSGKKYYVRIRTYKTVNGSKIYSSWSSVKSVKVK